MVGAFGPGAVWGVLPQPDGSLLHITTSHGNTEITAAGGLLPPGRTSKLAARPDYLIPATAAGKTASRIGAAHLPAMPQGASASSATAIVVLGLYTDDLVELRGSVSAAETEVTNLFAIANQAHLDSATGVQLKVAALKRVSVDPELANDVVLDAATNNTIAGVDLRSEEHTSELQSLMRNSYAVFCLK